MIKNNKPSIPQPEARPPYARDDLSCLPSLRRKKTPQSLYVNAAIDSSFPVPPPLPSDAIIGYDPETGCPEIYVEKKGSPSDFLGDGSFGSVASIQIEPVGVGHSYEVARKIYYESGFSDDLKAYHFLKKSGALEHENIFKVVGFTFAPPSAGGMNGQKTRGKKMYMEICPRHFSEMAIDLFENPGARLSLGQQLVDVTKFLVEKGVRHNDMSAGNMMFTEEFDKLKLIDFNMATKIEPDANDDMGLVDFHRHYDNAAEAMEGNLRSKPPRETPLICNTHPLYALKRIIMGRAEGKISPRQEEYFLKKNEALSPVFDDINEILRQEEKLLILLFLSKNKNIDRRKSLIEAIAQKNPILTKRGFFNDLMKNSDDAYIKAQMKDISRSIRADFASFTLPQHD